MFPKVAKAKAAGETGDIVEAEDEGEVKATGAATDHDYILGDGDLESDDGEGT